MHGNIAALRGVSPPRTPPRRRPQPRATWRTAIYAALGALVATTALAGAAHAGQLSAGAGKVDITNRDAGPVNDPLYAKALVIKDGGTALVIVTVGATLSRMSTTAELVPVLPKLSVSVATIEFEPWFGSVTFAEKVPFA